MSQFGRVFCIVLTVNENNRMSLMIFYDFSHTGEALDKENRVHVDLLGIHSQTFSSGSINT